MIKYARLDHDWNSLPAALRRPKMTLHTFKWQLKAYLFYIWCAGEQKEHSPPPGAFSWFWRQNARYKTADLLTYLLIRRCFSSSSPSLTSDEHVPVWLHTHNQQNWGNDCWEAIDLLWWSPGSRVAADQRFNAHCTPVRCPATKYKRMASGA